jgi:hypothetical protein
MLIISNTAYCPLTAGLTLCNQVTNRGRQKGDVEMGDIVTSGKMKFMANKPLTCLWACKTQAEKPDQLWELWQIDL